MGNKTKTETSHSVMSGDVAGEMSTGLVNGTVEAGHLPASTIKVKAKMNNTESETTTNKNNSPSEEVAVVFGLDSPVGSGTSLADSVGGNGTGLTDSAPGSGTDLTDSACGNGTTGPEVDNTKGGSEGEKEGSPRVTEDKLHPEHADKFDTDAVSGNGTYMRSRRNGKPVFLR